MNDTIDILMRIEEVRPEAIIEWWNLYCFNKIKMMSDLLDMNYGIPETLKGEIKEILKNRN